MSGEGDKAPEGPNRITVFLRIRPSKKGEITDENGGYLMDIQPDNKTVIVKEGGGKPYTFDYVFDGPNVDQEDIFKRVAVPVIENVFKGYWGSMMVYGQTGTGKSFTMCNFSPTCPGIIPRTMKEMFDRIEADTDREYTVLFSFIQIYLDRLQDLFNPEAGTELRINRDDKDGVTFPGIVEKEVRDEAHFRELYEDGNQYRVITATKMNPESSRGHAALFIQIKSKPKNDDGTGEHRSGKLMLIDLAGYERFSKTGVQEGIMKEEAKTINASLLSLGNVVQGLSEKASHVPWRNAKLTRMLQDAIGGRAKCSIILTAGPSAEHYHETVGTLYFGSRAMAVKTDAKLALNVDYQKLAKKLQAMLSQAEEKINYMEVQATERALERERAEARMQTELAALKKRQEDQLQELLTDGASPDKIRALMEGNKVEVELLEEQHYQERSVMEEENEKAIQEEIQQETTKCTAESTGRVAKLEAEMEELRAHLKKALDEAELLREELKAAQAEKRDMAINMGELRINTEQAQMEENVKTTIATSGGSVSASALEGLKKDYERQLMNVKEMLEEHHQLRLQATEDELKEEADKFRKLYEEMHEKYNRDITHVKDDVIAKYEMELEKVKTTSRDVQEKLKKNHMTIKQSYQRQKEEVVKENEQLLREIADLQEKVEKLEKAPQATAMAPASPVAAAAVAASATAPVAPDNSSRPKGPSRAELLILKKQEERKVRELEEKLTELENDLSYAKVEKEQMQQTIENLRPKTDDDLMTSSAVRSLKAENEKLLAENAKHEKELMKLKASLAMSGPKVVAEDDADELGQRDDNVADDLGDFEGLATFRDKMMRHCFLPSGGNIATAYDHVLNNLNQELTDYRSFLRYRLFFVGDNGTGKSSLIKCFTNSTPVIKGVPEVSTPTMFPSVTMTSGFDDRQGSGDLFNVYVKGQDPSTLETTSQTQLMSPVKGMMNMLGTVVGMGGADPAKVMWELLDNPGHEVYWNGLPSSLLPTKNTVYAVTYKISQPLDIIREELVRHLSMIHASVHMKRTRGLGAGGDAIRVGVVLLGTHRDALRDIKELNATLQRVSGVVGEILYQLKSEDSHHGITVVGNYAVSCKEWTVCSNKRNSSTNFKDLLASITTAASALYPIRPAALLPQAVTVTTSPMSFLASEDMHESDTRLEKPSMLSALQKRLRKGVITLCTVLAKERKQKWLYDERQFRSLVAAHLGMKEGDPKTTCYENYVIQELTARGLIVVIPSPYANEATMPPAMPIDMHDLESEAFTAEDSKPRHTLICLDPIHLITFSAHFLQPGLLLSGMPLPKDDRNATALLEQLRQRQSPWTDGFIGTDTGSLTLSKAASNMGNDIRLGFELACILGLALQAKQENGVLAPALFMRRLSPVATDYIPFLLSMYGDGFGRKYNLNAAPGNFFHRLQVKLIPFSHSPSQSSARYNWHDASYLVLQKDRFKWGVIGSSALKAAIVAANSPVRGLLKIEADCLYVVVVARGTTSGAEKASRRVMDAIHKEITLLCRREFRGVRASFQEMPLSNISEKRAKNLTMGVEEILKRHKAPEKIIQEQLSLVGSMGEDVKGGEIDAALNALFTAVPNA
eukprot:PhM_4_TR13280/c0_g1_i1/m.36338/K10396/KIF5; kinesin family member 5